MVQFFNLGGGDISCRLNSGVLIGKSENYLSRPTLHRLELPGNYPVFAVVMVIYHYVERIWKIIVTPNLL